LTPKRVALKSPSTSKPPAKPHLFAGFMGNIFNGVEVLVEIEEDIEEDPDDD
jgi:hypothetical protein